MPIWGHSAISFRTCRGNKINKKYLYVYKNCILSYFCFFLGGEILSQQYNRHTLWLSVMNDYITLSLVGPKTSVEARIHDKLLDNKWHTIQFLYQYGVLNFIIDHKSMIVGNSEKKKKSHLILLEFEIMKINNFSKFNIQ